MTAVLGTALLAWLILKAMRSPLSLPVGALFLFLLFVAAVLS